MSGLARLGSFARRAAAEERCGLCAAPLAADHPHLAQTGNGKLLCSCAGCASVLGQGSGKFRRLPDRVTRLSDFRMTDAQWELLAVPVGIAFFQKSALRKGMVAFYPSPLGAVESSVPAEAWDGIVRDNPALASLQEDVEALLVRREGSRRECFIAPLDACYGLIGLMRREWRGFTGGDEVAGAVERFFEGLRARSGGAA